MNGDRVSVKPYGGGFHCVVVRHGCEFVKHCTTVWGARRWVAKVQRQADRLSELNGRTS